MIPEESEFKVGDRVCIHNPRTGEKDVAMVNNLANYMLYVTYTDGTKLPLFVNVANSVFLISRKQSRTHAGK